MGIRHRVQSPASGAGVAHSPEARRWRKMVGRYNIDQRLDCRSFVIKLDRRTDHMSVPLLSAIAKVPHHAQHAGPRERFVKAATGTRDARGITYTTRSG
jgi:hypothetical protein